MATIHFICGFMGFGKTTFSKQLAKEINAKHFAIDDVIVERYGRDPKNFDEVYQKADNYIWEETEKLIKEGKDVILDYGFWNPETRQKVKEKALKLTSSIKWHQLICGLDEAKERVLKRTKDNKQELYIDEECFYDRLKRYTPITDVEDLDVSYHYTGNYIGKVLTVIMDRPMGSKHPKHGFEYPVNYGYIPNTKSGDGEELDAYVLGVDKPLKEFTGKCIAIIHRTNDNDDKLVVVPNNMTLSNEKIEKQVEFQEKWFKHIILRQAEK